jgi:hypothetical protein
MLNKIFEKLIWIFDYYILYFMYNEKKLHRYHNYMKQKYQNYGK